jgi:hypothetical protein
MNGLLGEEGREGLFGKKPAGRPELSLPVFCPPNGLRRLLVSPAAPTARAGDAALATDGWPQLVVSDGQGVAQPVLETQHAPSGSADMHTVPGSKPIATQSAFVSHSVLGVLQ